MGPFVVLTEIFALMGIVCLVHAAKPRVGLAPLYVLVGLFEAFLFVAGKAEPAISVELFGIAGENLSYVLFLPLILGTIVIVYVLEGTREARRMIVAVALVYVVHGGIDYIIEFHHWHPPPGSDALPVANDVVWFSTRARVASVVANMVDFIVIIVVYQFLYNRFSKHTLTIPFFAALVVAMLSDTVVFNLVQGYDFSRYLPTTLAKLQAGAAAALPVTIYLTWQLSKHKDQAKKGVLERGAFEIIDLRARLREVQEALKKQKAQYAYIKDTFSKYVSPEVVDAIVADPSKIKLGGELRTVTVLFADIRGYSTLSEGLDPTDVIDLLNQYFRRASHVILEQKGMVNEFEGDAILAIFNAPLDLPDHAQRALASAVALLEVVDKLNEKWEKDGTAERFKQVGLDRFSIRIGIHTGPVVAGNVGSEIRIKYAVIGDAVNLASRVEGLNKKLDTSLLLTSVTREDLKRTGSKVKLLDRGEHHVKGRVEPVKVFTVQGNPE